jgi:hypothetical protein
VEFKDFLIFQNLNKLKKNQIQIINKTMFIDGIQEIVLKQIMTKFYMELADLVKTEFLLENLIMLIIKTKIYNNKGEYCGAKQFLLK